MFELIRPMVIDDASLISSNVPESEPVWSGATTYAKGAVIRGNTTPTQHTLFESQQAGNLNHAPATDDGTWWLAIGLSNKFAMFDALNGTQTTRADSIAVTVQLTDVADRVALLNIAGATAQVVMTDDGEGVVFDQTFNLVSDEGITDYWEYFFEPIERLNDLLVSDLPPYYDATVAVTVADAGGSVAIGSCVIGATREIGETQAGARVGIKDYSRKETDQFGNYLVVERPFSRRASFSVFMSNALVDPTLKLLAEYRAVPIVWVGSGLFSATLVFGYFREANIEIAYPDHSLLSIDIEGLTQ